ncbi:MAG: phosphoribosylformylglycinamidine synthase subunit PurQ [Pseudomonadota bacterium]
MKSAVIVFPASNCDRDAAIAIEQTTGKKPVMVWHQETDLSGIDFIVIPGGFSYGDYLRSGAMAARSPIMQAVKHRAEAGAIVLGICNGFQILTETGLLPGALIRNAGIEFVCKQTTLKVNSTENKFTAALKEASYVTFPVAHHDGNYFADDETLKELENEGRIAFKYVENPNGSANDIAGITNKAGTVLGMMPHPERAISPLLGGTDGSTFFNGLLNPV